MRNLLLTLLHVLLICGQGVSFSSGKFVPKRKTLSIDDSRLVLSLTLPDEPDLAVTAGGEWVSIEVKGFTPLLCPGKPMLPAKNLLFLLPPGARVRAVGETRSEAIPLPGRHRIEPSPPVLPIDDLPGSPVQRDRALEEWQKNFHDIYGTNRPYPEKNIRLTGSGTLRKYSYAAISYCPFTYDAWNGKLSYHEEITVTIDYSVPEPGSRESESVLWNSADRVADGLAERLFSNYREVEDRYRQEPSTSVQKSFTPGKPITHDYVIITLPGYVEAINSSDFIPWKTSLGFDVKIVTIDDERIAGQAGADLPERIRNFLRQYCPRWGIEYVLIIGEHTSIPMRYCYPDPANHVFDPADHWSGEVPTDAYYADLSFPDPESWDLDGDGFYGEYGEDSPDFLPEVYVGRIPAGSPRISSTLDKIVAFEQDTGSWKTNALLAGAVWYFENEDGSGYPLYEGTVCMNEIETELMDGWTVSHYSEQGGLQTSAFDWPALTWESFTGDWQSGQYSIVNWGCHGSVTQAARKIWDWDDGDGVPEYFEIAWSDFLGLGAVLDDDYPSVFFSIACLNGYPEPNWPGRLGIDLLTEPSWGASVGSVGATRITYGNLGWPDPPGGAESICYEFNRHMIDGPSGPEKVGNALLNAKFYCYFNYPLDHFCDNWNMCNYSLYGDPSLVLGGVAVPRE